MAIPRRILIVGGGIAGLTLAVALQRRGGSPEIVELAPEWRPVGSGIAVGFNGILALNSLGLGRAVQESGVPLDHVTCMTAGGDVTARFGFGGVADVYGAMTTGIHRAALHDVLVGALENPAVRQGVTVTALHHRTGVVLADFSDGTRGEYDLVVGADGKGSRIRYLTFGAVRPRYAGYAAIRVVVPRPSGFDGLVELWGKGRRMGILPIGEDLLYSYSTIACAPGAERSAAECLLTLREAFADFSGPAELIINATPDADAVHYSDIEQIVIPKWVNGNVALIGDAAHAMCPDLGQGGSMAIEDAITLVRSLERSDDVAGALKDYEASRQGRVRSIQQRSRTYGWMVHRKAPLSRAVRNGIVRRARPRRLAHFTVASLINPLP